LVTSWGNRCGIAEHSALLKRHVEAADPGIIIWPSAETLDPEVGLSVALGNHLEAGTFDLVHLNHHDALHSRWTAAHVHRLMEKVPVVVTYHDTREVLDLTSKLNALSIVAASTVVHEPVEGLRAIYWRQGVPAAAQQPVSYAYNHEGRWLTDSNPPPEYQQYLRVPGYVRYLTPLWKASPQQPVLGSVGFNFPWKNFTRLAEITGQEGWALVLIAHDATEEQAEAWRKLNSSVLVIREFLPQDAVVNYLAGCDATAFMYDCANTGTSAAIRQGIAARKPVLANGHCRQFRDLFTEYGIRWVQNWEDFPRVLQTIEPAPWDAGVTALAHTDSWTTLGQKYAQLYRMLAGAR
jgi:hypothetical protein